MPIIGAPLPDAPHKGFAAQILAALALGGQGALHHVLGRNASMIRAWNPEHILALLTGMAAEHIYERQIERMADMQSTGNVGRRNDNGIWLARRVRAGGESSAMFPILTPAAFHIFWFVAFGKRFRHLAFSMKRRQ